ncbi:PPOX class F420-dependent oxidoreductase [Wenjunlia tyrosinilytica]|jgi:PPOX class probable F420-dependent enzyme|uniref:PPOX class F420-dependent enzyme n=1 Tax=Wenjunlia tyrosinilytica TaxID=1544741 RepID=A0A917ZMJ7_9ACTN|nr:PPOX class F420-dependent oxidoreductase [Wenjunlia tyrosinilytica]GGO87149.1 PPOX class F420-dependent enzyme [Wenjunlia tyrosinilytica]
MRNMTDAEWREFVLTGTRTAKVATTRKDGRPHVAPVWFLLDGDDLVFNTAKESVKGRTLRAPGARAAVCVDDDRPPYSYVMLEGAVTVSEDLGEVRTWAARIGGRYMGEDRAEEFGERNGVPGELLVRVRIDKVVAHADMAD